MCGFFFCVEPGDSGAELRARAEAACERMHHRGPDERGVFAEDGAAAGHCRLSVIDLESSRQPMHSPDGRFVLVYNGEIYNYREIRAGLEAQWEFRTGGDTETLLAALATRGADCLTAMEGMWAFALWDRERRTLTLGRDRLGKKPLFYRAEADRFACASELPALAAAGGSWEEDPDSSADYLRYGYYLPGTTAYRGVREVLPGHTARWSAEAGWRQRRYWNLPAQPFVGTRDEAWELLRERLSVAVERRLVADVEVGAFLSGGVDSSLIVGLLPEAARARTKTFTIGFTDPSYDERAAAATVAARFGTDHHVECLERLEGDDLQRLVLDHVGQPFADPSLLPTAMVARLAARHVKVALSGDGGDELFSGYQRYQARAMLRWYSRLPAVARGSVRSVVRALPEPMVHHSGSVLKKARLFVEAELRAADERPYVAPRFYTEAELADLAPDLAGRGHPAPGLPDACHLDDVHAMMAADALVYLPQDILAKVDRATMAHSLESRAPFLDSGVVELAFSLPRRWHRRWTSGKRMLRDAFPSAIPEAVWQRRKQGFAVPVNRWFQSELGDRLLELARDGGHPFRRAGVESMVAAHRAGRRDLGLHLWGIYTYLSWQAAAGDGPIRSCV